MKHWIRYAGLVASRLAFRTMKWTQAWQTQRARQRDWQRDRDAFMQLVWQEDRILSDAGISREDINWATRLPLHANAALELRKRLDRRRHCAGQTKPSADQPPEVQPVTRKSTASTCVVRVASA